MNLWFMAAVVLRAVVIAIALATSRLTGGMTLWVLRWAGLIGPIVVSVLTIQILKYRNTQSATGVLYAATTLVFIRLIEHIAQITAHFTPTFSASSACFAASCSA